MIKNLFQFILLASIITFAAACGSSQNAEESEETADSTVVEEADAESEEEKKPLSPRMQATGEVGTATVTIDYGAPSVRERTIWGDLEKYGKVWRAGANETTNIEFTSDVVLGETPVAAGKYGLFMIPNEEGDWVLILNTQYSREDHGIWGAMGYSEENDVARINVTPTFADETQEELMYAVDGGTIKFAWDKARIEVPVKAAEGAE